MTIVLYIYFSKLIWLQKNLFTQIFIYFSKPLRLLYSLIIYEIVNFLSSLFTICFFFFLSISENVPIYVIVHVHRLFYVNARS